MHDNSTSSTIYDVRMNLIHVQTFITSRRSSYVDGAAAASLADVVGHPAPLDVSCVTGLERPTAGRKVNILGTPRWKE